MEILENVFIYALEIGKVYMVLGYFLGIEARKGKWRYGCAAVLLIGFTVFLRYCEGNPILGYFVFITAEMYLLFREKLGKLAVISLWLASIIEVLDEIAIVFIEIFSGITDEQNFFVKFSSSFITILFVGCVIFIIKKIYGKNTIKINLTYYLLFSVLGLIDSMLIGGIRLAYESMDMGGSLKLLFLAAAVCMYIQMGMFLALAVSRDKYKEKELLDRRYLEIQKEQYDYLEKKEADIRNFRHDMNDHMLALRELCEEENYDEIRDYVKKIMMQMHIEDNKAATGNGIVDAIINQYLFQAEKEGVKLKIIGKFLEDDKINSYDYCIIFSNLLRNAIEAAEESEKKRVGLLVEDTKNEVLIRVWNDYKGERKMENGKYVTMKGDKANHGIGLSNIQKSVEKYNGVMKIMEKEEKFTVMISMQK